MSVFRLPKGILAKLDAICRSFFWKAEEKCSGAACLIAWKDVCLPKDQGGLGIKNLQLQNDCLLMKFAAKTLLVPHPPWVDWFHSQYPLDSNRAPTNTSFLWKTVHDHMPALQNISFVLTNN